MGLILSHIVYATPRARFAEVPDIMLGHRQGFQDITAKRMFAKRTNWKYDAEPA